MKRDEAFYAMPMPEEDGGLARKISITHEVLVDDDGKSISGSVCLRPLSYGKAITEAMTPHRDVTFSALLAACQPGVKARDRRAELRRLAYPILALAFDEGNRRDELLVDVWRCRGVHERMREAVFKTFMGDDPYERELCYTLGESMIKSPILHPAKAKPTPKGKVAFSPTAASLRDLLPESVLFWIVWSLVVPVARNLPSGRALRPFIEAGRLTVGDAHTAFGRYKLLDESGDDADPSGGLEELLCEHFSVAGLWTVNALPKIAKAIQKPDEYGVPDPGSSTGYALGVSKWMVPKGGGSHSKVLTMVRDFINTSPQAKEMISTYETEREETESRLRKKAAKTAAPTTTPEPSTEHESDDHMATTKSSSKTATKTASLPMPAADEARLIDMTLSTAGLPSIKTLIEQINNATASIERAAEEKAKLETRMRAAAAEAMTAKAEVTTSGELPSGKVRMVKAKDAFGIKGAAASAFDFDLPCWEWEGPHPDVPEVDEFYIFRNEQLLVALAGLLMNEPTYIHGHTGSGKTTLIEQIAARLNWPFVRVNFDSEITRMDLIGRDTLSTDADGKTVSEFVDGILPQMLSGPNICCFDEVDFVRADIAYVMQRALENDGLIITEDGGRRVHQHVMTRIFATGNTVGQGDEFGMYQGARNQSLAFMDRFTNSVHVPYMPESDRLSLIKARVPELGETEAKVISKYVSEHLDAFTSAKVLQPLSPRGYVSLARKVAFFATLDPASGKSGAAMIGDTKARTFKLALQATVLNRCSEQDRSVLSGIGQRVFGY